MDENATEDYLSFVKDSIEKDNCLVLVAETESKLIGFLRAEIVDRPPVFKVNKIGDIGDLFVKKEWRRKGIGSRLVKEAEVWFEKREINLLKVSVYVKNKSAQKFWDSKEFKDQISIKYRKSD